MSCRGNKCVYINCGKSRRDDPYLQHYKFPKEEIFARKWIINSGNSKLLDLSAESLNKKLVCVNHFQNDDFTNPTTKRRLVKGTIPRAYNEAPSKEQSSSSAHSPIRII